MERGTTIRRLWQLAGLDRYDETSTRLMDIIIQSDMAVDDVKRLLVTLTGLLDHAQSGFMPNLKPLSSVSMTADAREAARDLIAWEVERGRPQRVN